MEELEFIKKERIAIQEEYFVEAKKVWTNKEGKEAEKEHKKVYSNYRNKDKFLEHIEARLESCLEDLEHYKNK